jgi:uncharacterized membrane protein
VSGPVRVPFWNPRRVIFALIIALAAWLRLSDLAGQSLWWDEVVSLEQSRLPFGEMLAATAADNYPPLYNIILQLFIRLFGESEIVLRLPSALMGIATVPALYWLVDRMQGNRAALIAAVLLTLSPFHLWYSGEARMYALLALTATLFVGCVVLFARTGRWRYGILAVPGATALLYSHPYGALTWGAIGLGGLVLLWGDWRRLGGFIGLQLLAAIAFLPWALVLLDRAAALNATGFWIQPVTPWSLFQMLIQLIGGPFLFAAFVVGLRICLARTEARNLAFLLIWALLPMVLGAILSALVQPMLISRYLIGSLPALLAITAIGFGLLKNGRSLDIGVAALVVAALIGTFFYQLRPRDDFRGLAAELEATAKPGDCLVMIPEAAIALRYYDPEPPACLATFRTVADLELGAVPGRILVLDVLDTNLAGLDTLGTETSRKPFGPSALITIAPK